MKDEFGIDQTNYEYIVNTVNGFTEEEKWVAIRSFPAEMLWRDLYSRYQEQSKMVDSIRNVARA